MARNSRFNRVLRRTLHPVYRSLETTVHPLRYLFLEITQKCNLACLHCGSDCSKKPRANELTTGEWIDFIDYLSTKYKRGKDLFLVITGGEPLCHPELGTILERIRHFRFPFGIVTNGYMLNRKNTTMLVENGIGSITVSLDGLKTSHDWLRGTTGSFHRAVKGLSIVVRGPIPIVDVVTCVHPRNISELPEILDLLKKTGVNRWRLFNIFPKGRAGTNRELLLSESQLVQMFDWLRTTRKELENTDFHLDFGCEGYLPKTFDAEVRDEPYFCRAGICIGSVLCDGDISACPNITRALVQGNIRNDDFATVWEHEFKQYRDRSWMKKGECAECAEWKRCNGNSLHLWDDDAEQTVLCYPKALNLLKH
ncbi:MAG: radical SAM protein [Deltaproteobacteria bacterium]|nr:radical SAM protein [Deltaproteobacteria bacterium]